jgi:very-short-patch-repair endonuclease
MQPRAVRPDRARRLRGDPTNAELRWQNIRKKQLSGYRFRRQVPIGPYVTDFVCADFVCIERSLVVEVDGGQHSWREAQDLRRTTWLEARGWRVVRFWNNEVLENLAGVLERLMIELGDRGELPQPKPLPLAGEGATRSESGP